jgi:hypothetical protein
MPGQLPGRSADAHDGSRAGAILTALLLCAIADTAWAQAPTPDRPQWAIDQDSPEIARQPSSRILISEPVTGRTVREALRKAWTQLEEPSCQALLTDFSDQHGRPLTGNIPGGIANLRTYLATLVIIDGSDTKSCAKGALAVAEPGSRVVRVCGSRFVWTWQQNSRHVVAALIHEALHTLGLGENPPSSSEITSRVLKKCGAIGPIRYFPDDEKRHELIDQDTPVSRNTVAREEPKESAPARTATDRPTAWPRLHLADPVARLAARQALDLAWERLGGPGCGRVLDVFTDGSGRPLEQQLRALSVDLQTYLTMVVFIDASRERPCVTGTLAFTTPGNRVVRLCLDELKRIWEQDPEHVVATFIHEMLHSLGLTENPPSSAEITRRVLEVCHRR